MSKLLLIFIELLLLATLSWYCISVESADVETDLAHRSNAVLGYAGLDRVKAEADGQEIILTGSVESPQQRSLAIDSVASVWGVTRVHDRLGIEPAESSPPDLAKAQPQQKTAASATEPGQNSAGEQCGDTLQRLAGAKKLRFALGSDELTPDSLPLLDEIAALLKRCDGFDLEITGHTDSVGKADDNLALSEARARSVARRLEKLGIPPDRLHASGKGESEPIADNATAEGRERNRRIDFQLRPTTNNN